MTSFFHLSHTDLDGYGCQFISKKIYPKGLFFNANYGIEVKTALNTIVELISKSENKNIFFLITDLNLNEKEAKFLNGKIEEFKTNGIDIKLQLLDHHGTGEKSANRYSWYFLDTSKSATKITYEYFKKNYKEFETYCDDKFETLIESINAVDIWLEDSLHFEFGKVCLTMISDASEINNTLFANENRNYRLNLLQKALGFVDLKDGHIKLDEKIYHIKKDYLKGDLPNNTMDNISSKYLIAMLQNEKENFTIYYKQHKGLLTFALHNISILANEFLKANDDYDFFINISRRGKCSLRANGKLDVSLFAQTMANGGGHPNASGMAFSNWKELVNYSDVKKFIEKEIKIIS
jgi:oligoribonuclease NrnB/cAMP/cGMP phosphodiesterase (DHH superfamily)